MSFLVEGDYFKIKSSSGSLTVTGDTFGSLGGMLQGQGLRDTDFKRLTLTDETGAINNGYLLVSDGNFVDDRITGEVSVIDGGKARTLSNIAFAGYAGIAAVAAQYLVVEQVQATSTFAGLFTMRAHNATFGSFSSFGQPKKIGGTDSVGAFYATNNAAVLGAGKILGVGSVVANGNVTFRQAEPIVIPPNFGLCIYSNTLASDLYANFEFYEDPI
jgi:hypothetical protein